MDRTALKRIVYSNRVCSDIGDSMKIAFFISALSGGGAERVTCNLANYLNRFGHVVEILTMADTEAADSIDDGVVHSPLLRKSERKNFLWNNIVRLSRLIRHMKRNQVDAYVVMLPITTIMMLFLSKLTRVPIIAAERVDPKAYDNTKQFFLRRLAKRASGWIFQTDEVSTWYDSWLEGKKSIVIPNAINPAFLRPEYTGEREKKIVATGRLTEQKNFSLLIHAFAKVSADFPDHKLVIYGKGGLKDTLTELAKSLGITDRVEFPGYVKNIQEELERAQMFVLSSDYEGMPNALMEAMALGLPCVSTDCGGGGARFLIEDGVNGLLVPVCDEVAMSEAIRAILSDPEKAAELSKNARKIQETLAPEKIYGQWEMFISEIAERS